MAQQAISTQLTALQLDQVAATVALLRQALSDYGTVTYSNSLGAESMVLTDLICTQVPQIDIFSIDTGRLPEETYTLLERVERRYGRRLRLVHPQAEAVQSYASEHGINGFYNGLAERQACCHIRKIEPFRRAIAGFGAWVTGVRSGQSATRATAQAVEFDAPNGLHKISPILDWTHDDVWAYIRSQGLPYNALHDKGYPSIGCEPCTRAVDPGDDSRSGRWWWENTDSRECGLHPRIRIVPQTKAPA